MPPILSRGGDGLLKQTAHAGTLRFQSEPAAGVGAQQPAKMRHSVGETSLCVRGTRALAAIWPVSVMLAESAAGALGQLRLQQHAPAECLAETNGARKA